MSSRTALRSRPRVALLVETSLAPGRDILLGIAAYVRRHGPWALYHEPRSLEQSVPRWLRSWQGDGIIARIQNRQIAAAVAATGIPVVDVLGMIPEAGFPLVHVDDEAIARLAAEHLLERGFRSFGFFGIKGENWSQRRSEAFGAVVGVAGGAFQTYELPRDSAGDQSWEAVEDDLARWIVELPKPAGVMICSDQRGPQFLEACRRARVQVPDEVAVVGVDDDQPLCEVCNPSLSSVSPSHVRVGFEAARALERLMRGGRPRVRRVLVPPEGVITRLSTDVLAIADRSVATAVRLIREHACDGLRIDTLARQVGLSRSVLQRRFRSLLKRSIHDELVQARLKRAIDLLTRTDLPLDEIAEKCGFKHQEYMGAVFQRRLRTTPARLRRERRG